MIPNRHAMVGARGSVGNGVVAATAGSAGPIIYPSQIQPGDLAVLLKHGAAPAAPWSTIAAPIGSRTPGIYSVLLAPSDLISPIVTDQNHNCIFYRGVLSLALRATLGRQGPPGSEANALGFTKSANCAGRLAIAGGPVGYSGASVSVLPAIIGTNNGTVRWTAFGDMDASFVSGAGVNIGWDASDPSGAGFAMLELLK